MAPEIPAGDGRGVTSGGKKFTLLKMRTVEPQGEITDAGQPLPVRVRIEWNLGGSVVIENAWAMAWTRAEVLVFWRTPGIADPTTAWVRAEDVRRR